MEAIDECACTCLNEVAIDMHHNLPINNVHSSLNLRFRVVALQAQCVTTAMFKCSLSLLKVFG